MRATNQVRPDDVTLVAEAKAGSDSAFAQIYDAYSDHIHDFCASVLRDRHEAADVSQDTFVIAYRRLDMLRDPSKLKAWLYSIARHECLQRMRSRKRTLPRDPSTSFANVVDTGPTPEEAASKAELRTLVWQAAEGLSKRDRAVLDLSARQDLSGQDLADALGTTRQNAYALLSNVKKRTERSLGALLVSRTGSDDCNQLKKLVSTTDRRFSPLSRKRIARHVDGCQTCQECRDRTMSPLALLSAVPLAAAPALARTATLGAAATAKPLTAAAAKTAAALSKESGFAAASGGTVKTGAIIAAGASTVVAAGVVATLTIVGGTSVSEYCIRNDEFNAAVGEPPGPSASPEEVAEFSATAIPHLDRLAEVAPPEILDDIIAIRDDVARPRTNDSLGPRAEAAKQRFDDFNRSECGP